MTHKTKHMALLGFAFVAQWFLVAGELAAAVRCDNPYEPCESERQPPPPPSSITYPTEVSATSGYTVSWTGLAAASFFELEEKVGTGNWTLIQTSLTTSKSYSSKSPGTYQYRVRTCADSLLFEGCSIEYRAGGVLTVVASPPPPLPLPGRAPPTILETQPGKSFTWVLIHGDVPFLVPSFADARDGAASVRWSPIPAAVRYEIRLQINGQWSSWVSVGSDTFYNFYSENATSVVFEVRSCDAAGCGSGTSQTVTLSSWRDVGTCNPNTGEQQQVCIAGSCQHQLRYVARCSATTTCNIL